MINFRKNRNRGVNYRIEVVTDNFVDKDVQSMLRPLNLMTNIFFNPFYRIKNGFITPNSCISNCLTFCFLIFALCLFFYRSYDRVRMKAGVIKSVSVINIDYFTDAFVTIFRYTVIVLYSKNNAMFVLNFVKVNRFLNDEVGFKRFIFGNWVSVVSLFFINVFLIFYICLMLGLPSYNLICGCIYESMDIHVLYAIRLINLLKHKIQLWNCKVFELQSVPNGSLKKGLYKKMFQSYFDILHCYDFYKSFFQFLVS